MRLPIPRMSTQLALFAGATVGTLLFLNVALKPKTFRLVLIGVGVGCAFGGTISYVNYLRRHSIKATYIPIGLSKPKMNYLKVQPLIYDHLSTDYEERGELELGEEHITVQPNVFAQIGIIDTYGIRNMWTTIIMPALTSALSRSNLENMSLPAREVEENIVFCDIGSGVGNVCMQILTETNCKKTVGIEVIPSRLKASEVAMAKAKKLFPEEFDSKEAVWIQDDLVNCAEALKKEGVNVVFTHSWMFDDDLMHTLTEVLAQVPSLKCVITSRKLDNAVLAKTSLKLENQTHFSADWNDKAPFFIYTTNP